MSKLSDDGLIFITGSIYRERHNFSGNLLQLPKELTHFRKRIDKKGTESLLKLSIDLFNPKIQKKEAVIYTTVQKKNITYPTDSKLAKKVIDTCRNNAIQEGIPLRQSYSRVPPQLLR